MVDLDMLQAAAREVDVLINGIPDMTSSFGRRFGAEWRDVKCIAEQLAVRMILIQRDRAITPGHSVTVEPTPEERELMIRYAAIGVDGICIGLRAMAAWVDKVAQNAGNDR